MDNNFIENIFKTFISIGIIIGVCAIMVIWGGWMLVDYFYINDSVKQIESQTLIQPQFQLIIKDNQVDTIYIYKTN